MIRLQDLTPEVYYNESRDFQFIGRLFDVVLNSVKTEADLLMNLPLSTNSPDELLELMTFTFGLKLDLTKYTNNQLRAICSIAPHLMRTKGTMKAVELICTALLRAEGVEGTYKLQVKENNLEVIMPPTAQNKELLRDLLPYVLPAGITFTVKRATQTSHVAQTTLGLADNVAYYTGVIPNQKVATPSSIGQDLLWTFTDESGATQTKPRTFGRINASIVAPTPAAYEETTQTASQEGEDL
jgi:hypothetical protein